MVKKWEKTRVCFVLTAFLTNFVRVITFYLIKIMKETLVNIVRWCRRYISLTLLIVVAFVVYVLFFNENSIMRSLELNDEIESLKAEIKDNTDSLDYYSRQLQLLHTDPETMEKIVREYYHMQHPDEDVYVFEK